MQKKWFRHLIEGIWGLGTGIWGLAAAGPFLEALAGLFKAGFLTFFAFLGGLEFSNLRSIKMISSLKMVSLEEILILNPATTHPKKTSDRSNGFAAPLVMMMTHWHGALLNVNGCDYGRSSLLAMCWFWQPTKHVCESDMSVFIIGSGPELVMR